MTLYSTTQAAKRVGIGAMTLSRYIAEKKVPAPRFMQSGSATYHVWTEEEVEELRKLLPKIANGRKTRWQRQRETEKKKQSKAKTKTQPGAPQPQHAKTGRAGDPRAAVRKRKKK
jgi:hypothetical protein